MSSWNNLCLCVLFLGTENWTFYRCIANATCDWHPCWLYAFLYEQQYSVSLAMVRFGQVFYMKKDFARNIGGHRCYIFKIMWIHCNKWLIQHLFSGISRNDHLELKTDFMCLAVCFYLILINIFSFWFKKCLRPTWYICVDMQLFIVSPVLVYLMHRFKKTTLISMLTSVLCCVLYTVFICINENIRDAYVYHFIFRRGSSAHPIKYIKPVLYILKVLFAYLTQKLIRYSME